MCFEFLFFSGGKSLKKAREKCPEYNGTYRKEIAMLAYPELYVHAIFIGLIVALTIIHGVIAKEMLLDPKSWDDDHELL